MNIIADLQLHSKYSRAVSQQMVLPEMARWAKRKGIHLLATGDWTHPLWFKEIEANLEEVGNGILKLKTHPSADGSKLKSKVEEFEEEQKGREPLFLLATEISSIYSQGGKLRRIHNLVWAQSLATARKINQELTRRGANLMSDGRPIVGLSSKAVAEIVFSIDSTCLIIPAHAWTPWFSLYGSESGFDSIDECFGEFAKNIYAIETGLSSDPAMNWRIKDLDTRRILSFSDAHSGPKLGREATVFRRKNQESGIKNQEEMISYENIRKVIMGEPGEWEIGYTIEFYPEEGKYHYTGHRNCHVKHTPADTRKLGTVCPVCGRKLTVGVMHRVDELAGRSEKEVGVHDITLGKGARAIASSVFPNRPAYVMLVPLQEILAESVKSLVGSQKVQTEYGKLVDTFGGEFAVLLNTDIDEIAKVSGSRIADAISRVRAGNIVVDPGYDGVFGTVKIWPDEHPEKKEEEKEQLSLF